MKKKSILVSLVVAILAAMTFVGCSDSVVYPKTVTDAKITQIGDFLTGQNFDSNKFEVEVTYLDGSSSKTVGSVSLDSTSAGKVGKSSYVTYTATDFQGNEIYRELSVSVYDIDKVEVTEGPESYSAYVGEEPKIGQNTDYTITASYYANGVAKTMPLSSNEYYVTFNAYDEGLPEEATEAVGATLKIQTYVGGNEDFYAPIQVAVTEEPVDPVVVEEITGVSWNGNFMPFNYTELPEIAFEDVNVSAKVEGKETPVNLESDPGIEFSFVDATTHRPIRSIDLTKAANQDDLAIRAEYDGVIVFGNVTGYSDVDITVTYESDAKFVRGEALPAINPADYLVTMVVDNGAPEELTLDASAFQYMSKSQVYEGTIIPETDPLGVRVNYNGIYSATYAFTAEELVGPEDATPVAITGIKLADAYYTSAVPATQYYNTLPVFDQAQLVSITVSMSDGSTVILPKSDAIAAYYYLDEDTALSTAEPTDDGDYDVLLNATDILIKVDATYKGEELTYFETIELDTDPVIATLTPEDTYTTASGADITNPMIGNYVHVNVVAKDAAGNAIDKDFTDYTVLDSDGAYAEIPETVGKENLTYTLYVTDNPAVYTNVIIDAGRSFVSPAPEFVLKPNDAEKLYAVGTKIDTALITSNFAIDTESYDVTQGVDYETVKDSLVKVTAVKVNASKTLETGENVIPVVITYTDAEGKTDATAPVNVTIVGTPYVTTLEQEPVLLYDGKEFKKFDQGTVYEIAKFSISPDSFTGKGDVVIADPAVGCTGAFVNEEAGTVTGDMNSNYTFTFTYYNTANLTKTEKVLDITLGVYTE